MNNTTASFALRFRTALLCILVCSATFVANANDVELIDKPVTVEELGDLLFPRSKTRAIVINRKDPASPNRSKVVAMLINFKFGKADILPQSFESLDTLGDLLNHPSFISESLIIEGHTDTIGSAAYNQKLSEQRANAVRRYLVNRHNVDSSRLLPVGKGEYKPYDDTNSKAPINRRVQFKRL